MTLPKLSSLVVIIARVHVPNAALWGIYGELPEVCKFLRLRKHLDQPLIVRLKVLDLKEGGTLTFAGHYYLIKLPACFLQLPSQLSYQSILLLKFLLLPLDLLHVDVIDDVHLLELLLPVADLPRQSPYLLLTSCDLLRQLPELRSRKCLDFVRGHLCKGGM